MNNKKNKRIGIDARFYGPENKGLGRYTQEIVDGIIKLDQDNDYVIFLHSNNFDKFETSNPRVKKVRADIYWYTFKEQLFFPFLIWKEKLDFIHFLHFNVPLFTPVKFIVTIHDLILTKHPTKRASTLSPLMYKIKNLVYQIIIYVAAKRARYIIAVSEYTRQDIINKFKVKNEKVVKIYEGVASSLENQKADDKEVILGYNIHRPYLLYVGNAYPHKNLEQLIKVFANIKEKFSDLQLVLVGKKDYFYERLKKELSSKLYDDVVFAGFVPDKDLSSFYKEAQVYVFPSLFEGFGLPPLEAMTYGCVVVSSNKTCLPEVLGKAAKYFNPEDKTEMTQTIIEVLENKEEKIKLIKKGYEQVRKYSWKECNKNILKLYNLL